MRAIDLKIGDQVVYKDTDQAVYAKVVGIDNEKKIIRFIDLDEFEWEEQFNAIPETVSRKL